MLIHVPSAAAVCCLKWDQKIASQLYGDKVLDRSAMQLVLHQEQALTPARLPAVRGSTGSNMHHTYMGVYIVSCVVFRNPSNKLCKLRFIQALLGQRLTACLRRSLQRRSWTAAFRRRLQQRRCTKCSRATCERRAPFC